MTSLAVLLASGLTWIVIPTAIAVGILVLTTLTPRKTCQKCEQLLPRFRRPTSIRQLVQGGWTCPACDTKVDRKGEPRV